MNDSDAIMARAFGVRNDTGIVPVLSTAERCAYQAAWRIDREPVPETLNELGCKSARHARYIDHIAAIILQETRDIGESARNRSLEYQRLADRVMER